MSRLRERLRVATPTVPAAVQIEPGWEHCAIVSQYVSGSINLQYRFRAVAQRGTVTYTAGASPPFLTAPPPIEPTDGARAALTQLLDQLQQEGWQPDPQPADPWFARTLRRALPSRGKPPPMRRRTRRTQSED